jgi:hypothetical protein
MGDWKLLEAASEVPGVDEQGEKPARGFDGFNQTCIADNLNLVVLERSRWLRVC